MFMIGAFKYDFDMIVPFFLSIHVSFEVNIKIEDTGQ